MKVHDTKLVSSHLKQSLEAPSAPPQDFKQKLLKCLECIFHTHSNKPVASGESLSHANPSVPLPGPGQSPSTPYQKQVLERAESTLDLLETYRQGLMDPGMSLKELYPTVLALDREAEELLQLLSFYPRRDPFKELINQVALSVKVEVMKFNRGDYL